MIFSRCWRFVGSASGKPRRSKVQSRRGMPKRSLRNQPNKGITMGLSELEKSKSGCRRSITLSGGQGRNKRKAGEPGADAPVESTGASVPGSSQVFSRSVAKLPLESSPSRVRGDSAPRSDVRNVEVSARQGQHTSRPRPGHLSRVASLPTYIRDDVMALFVMPYRVLFQDTMAYGSH